MKRGSIYWINLEPAFPPELGKVRPGVIVSNTIQNEKLDSVVVIPLSTRAPDIWPLRFKLAVHGLKNSYVVVPGIRQVSKTRLHEVAGHIGSNEMARIDEALALYLGD